MKALPVLGGRRLGNSAVTVITTGFIHIDTDAISEAGDDHDVDSAEVDV